MNNDLISRQAAIEEVHHVVYEFFDFAEDDDESPMTYKDEMLLKLNKAITSRLKELPPAEPRWIPVKIRPMDEEERAYWSEHLGYDIEYEDAVMFDCPMPEDGQEVWVCSKCGNVWQDTCEVDIGFGLEGNGDWYDITAWMPFERPEPWKGEADAEV